MRVLVTGAAGFLGSAVCREAVRRGDIVEALVRPGELLSPLDGVAYEETDWGSSPEVVEALVRSSHPEIVVHCAGATPRLRSGTSAYYDANVRLAWLVLGAIAATAPHARMALVSSAAVYGAKSTDPIQEDAPLAPESHYGWSKILAEQAVAAFARVQGVHASIARPFNILGESEPAGSVVSDVVAQLRESAACIRIREADSVRDYVDVRDVARGLLTVAERGQAGEAYNLCTGHGTSVGELVHAILSVWGVEAEVEVTEPASEATYSVGSTAKADALGWMRVHDLRSSLERLRESLQHVR